MPRGFKICGSCNSRCPIALKKCKCGKDFEKKIKKKCSKCGDSLSLKQKRCSCGNYKLNSRRGHKFNPKMQGHYRLMRFVGRMLPMVELSKNEIPRELKIAKFILHICYEDYDFLGKLKRPHWIKSSLLWFKTKNGIKFLKEKYKEYLYQLPDEDIIIDEGEKRGEDIVDTKPRNLRDFLNE